MCDDTALQLLKHNAVQMNVSVTDFMTELNQFKQSVGGGVKRGREGLFNEGQKDSLVEERRRLSRNPRFMSG